MSEKNLKQFTLYIYAEQHDALHKLSDFTGVPMARLVRDAINDWLAKQPQDSLWEQSPRGESENNE